MTEKETLLRQMRMAMQYAADRNAMFESVYSKNAPTQDDPHKNNPEPIRGGCGNPSCRLCYNESGELNDESGKYGGVNSPPPNPYSPQPWAPRPDYNRDLLAAREPVAKYLLSVDHDVQWSDVVGNDRAKEELRDVIEAQVLYKDVYSFYNIKAPTGVMLFGPPGCGKTMFAKAVAASIARTYKESKAELMVINGTEIESPIISIAGKRVEQIFDYARAYFRYYGHPLVIFVDEADALLQNRNNAPWAAEVVSSFLACMDGMEQNGAFVMLATNRPEAIDQALLREGRIDAKIKVERPTYENAKLIVAPQLDRGLSEGWLPAEPGYAFIDYLFSAEHLIKSLTNPESGAVHHFLLQHIVSGAMLVGLVERAKRIAFRRDKKRINARPLGVQPDDLHEAVRQVFAENKELSHDYALREFVLDIALPAEEARKHLGRMN